MINHMLQSLTPTIFQLRMRPQIRTTGHLQLTQATPLRHGTCGFTLAPLAATISPAITMYAAFAAANKAPLTEGDHIKN